MYGAQLDQVAAVLGVGESRARAITGRGGGPGTPSPPG
jgi:hypothetical protein